MLVSLTCPSLNVRSCGQGQVRKRKCKDIKNVLNNMESRPKIISLQDLHMNLKDYIALPY